MLRLLPEPIILRTLTAPLPKTRKPILTLYGKNTFSNTIAVVICPEETMKTWHVDTTTII